MATVRKLQAEIDKTFRKVDEQQEVFQQVFDRLHECDQSLKEKYEVLLLIHATTMRFFSPELERTTVLSRCARWSLSRPTFYCDVFLCRDDEAWWSSSLGAFFLSAPLRVLEHCVLRANTSALCSASQFQTKWKERDLSLMRELSSSRLVKVQHCCRRKKRLIRTVVVFCLFVRSLVLSLTRRDDDDDDDIASRRHLSAS